MTASPRWLTFGLLQLGVFVLGFAVFCVWLPLALFLLWPGTLAAGVVLVVKGFGRATRGGMKEGAFVGRLVGMLALAMVGWIVALLIAANLPSRFSDALGWDILSIPALAVFSAGSLAYLGLGPFRSRLPAMARVRQLLDGGVPARIGLRASSDQIAEAERALGLRLPVSFVEFLKTWGELEIGPTKVLGIPGAPQTEQPSAGFVQATLDGRANLGLPAHFILCVSYPNNLHVCLDTFSMRSDEGPAVLWNSSTRVVTQTHAPTFADFLRDQLEAMSPSR
jgi:hypothetical protein